MITAQDILDIYIHMRETNTNISDEALDFMKNTCLAKLSNSAQTYVCTDFEISLNDMKMRKKNIKQPPNGSIFLITIEDR